MRAALRREPCAPHGRRRAAAMRAAAARTRGARIRPVPTPRSTAARCRRRAATAPPGIRSPGGTPSAPPRARSLPVQRHPDDVAGLAEPLDAIHQLAHEEEATAVLAREILGRRRIRRAEVEVEPLPFIRDLDDEAHRI